MSRLSTHNRSGMMAPDFMEGLHSIAAQREGHITALHRAAGGWKGFCIGNCDWETAVPLLRPCA